MSKEVSELAPVAVWRNFSKLNSVPRPSKKEERVIAFMMDFGEALGLETQKDNVGNVIIRKPATKGMEAKKMVTLQSHLDMVHQKNATTDFDFDTQGIAMLVDGDWVKAKGTTLGADNGMGVAAIMGLLESTSIAHPPLEALFTIDEETGMTGAFGLEAGVLQGEILLNLDTEEDDEIDIGCAGGIDLTATSTYKQKSAKFGATGYRIAVTGLKGGHSGMDIHKGLGNANKIMNRLLHAVIPYMRISSIVGGSLRNAIPRESVCEVNVHKDETSIFIKTIAAESDSIKQEFAAIEPQLQIDVIAISKAKKAMSAKAQEKFIKAIYAIHNGVYRMSPNIPNLVETSNNVATIRVAKGKISIGCLTRSSIESGKMDLANTLKSGFELAGYQVALSGSYPGWNPNQNSEVLQTAKTLYKTLFKEEARVVACHAGLECGILGQNYPDIDMISFGPTILGAHSPDERVSITSVQKFWSFLTALLKHTA